MDQPRTGHASIRETVNKFGMVYIFSRTSGAEVEPLEWSTFLSDRLAQLLASVLVGVMKTLLCWAFSWDEVGYSGGGRSKRSEAKVMLRRGKARM